MLKHGFKQMLAEASAMVKSVSVQDLPFLIENNEVVVVDVRDADERENEGQIPGSIHISRGLLEFKADPESPAYHEALHPQARLVLYCGTGGRSMLAARTLVDMGFDNVASLAGGYSAWHSAIESKIAGK